jgi:hypothetical protein
VKYVVLAVALVAQSAIPAEQVKLNGSTSIDINLDKLKGTLVRQLAWSPDKNELYLMTYEPNRDASLKEAFHFVIPLATGVPKRVDGQPEWAAAYWKWKSDRTAPGDPSFALEVVEEKRRQQAVALPMGGDMARGGTADPTGGLSQEAALDAARAMRNDNVISLKLKNEIVGEWINLPFAPGQTFGWGPANSGLIAYAEKSTGRLIIMDKKGDKQKINDTKGVILPAWADDGTKLAYLETRGRGRFALIVAGVAK